MRKIQVPPISHLLPTVILWTAWQVCWNSSFCINIKWSSPSWRKTCWRLSTQDTMTDLPRFSREPLNTSRLSLQLTWRKLIQPSTPMTLSANCTCPTMGGCGMVGAYLRPVSWWQFWVWSSWRATVPLRKTSGNFWIWCEYMLGENTSSTESPGSSSPKTLWRWSTWSTARLPMEIFHVTSSCGPTSPCWNQQNESLGIFGKSQWYGPQCLLITIWRSFARWGGESSSHRSTQAWHHCHFQACSTATSISFSHPYWRPRLLKNHPDKKIWHQNRDFCRNGKQSHNNTAGTMEWKNKMKKISKHDQPWLFSIFSVFCFVKLNYLYLDMLLEKCRRY